MRRIRAGLILSVGVAVASCGGSSTEPEDSLTGAEALALLEVAMNPGLQLTDELQPGSETLTPDGAVLQFTVPCTMGGTVGMTVRLGPAGEPDVDGGGVAVSSTLVHSGCIERHASGHAIGNGDPRSHSQGYRYGARLLRLWHLAQPSGFSPHPFQTGLGEGR